MRRRRLGDHFDRVAWALLKANGAARAELVVDAVAAARAKLYDRLLGAGGIAVVALEAVPAGQAPASFMGATSRNPAKARRGAPSGPVRPSGTPAAALAARILAGQKPR